VTSVILLELNEADAHFLERFRRQGRFASLARVWDEGVRVVTSVPGWDAAADRSWRALSPWIIWPSLYTGLAPAEHGLVGFGQDNTSVRGRCLWDVLDRDGVSTGVFGSLHSWPPRQAGHCAFYLPESLANDAACFPEEARPLQELFLLAARNYSEGFARHALRATRLLARTSRAGVTPETVLRMLWQVPAEKLRGERQVPERAMLHSRLALDAFSHLYAKHAPRFATLHLNHVAYMQHRYWRAAEPDRFDPGLGPADAAFFGTPEARARTEGAFSQEIERSFDFSERVVARLLTLLPEAGVLVVATGLGQRPYDPARGEIHNPVARLVAVEELLAALGVGEAEVRHQMNPDLTLDYRSPGAAAHASEVLSQVTLGADRLFEVASRGPQVFLELNLPPAVWTNAGLAIQHPRLGVPRPWRRHIRVRESREQSTAHHHDAGLLLAWSRRTRLRQRRDSVAVTEVAPTLLSLFGIPAQPWMAQGSGAPAFEVA
jgi:hypothetical protein